MNRKALWTGMDVGAERTSWRCVPEMRPETYSAVSQVLLQSCVARTHSLSDR